MSTGSTTTTVGYGDLPQSFQDLGTSAASYLQSILGSSSNVKNYQQNSMNLANTDTSSQYNYLNDVLNGKYTDVSTNTALQDALKSITDTSTKSYDSAIQNQLQSANTSGNFFSSANTGTQNALSNTFANDLTDQLATKTLDEYNTERGYQNAASGQLNDYLNTQSGLQTSGLANEQSGINSISSLLSSALGGTSSSGSSKGFV